MIIYASNRYNYSNQLDAFIGKDVWVKAQIRSNRGYWDTRWIKFIDNKNSYSSSRDYREWTLYTINLVKEDAKYYPDYNRFLAKIADSKNSYYGKSIELVRPLETLTTEELFELVKDDSLVEQEAAIDSTIGTDNWILVSMFSRYFYINAKEKRDNGWYVCDKITYSDIMDFGGNYAIQHTKSGELVSFDFNLNVITPLDIVTTDEIAAMQPEE